MKGEKYLLSEMYAGVNIEEDLGAGLGSRSVGDKSLGKYYVAIVLTIRSNVTTLTVNIYAYEG